MPVQTHDIAAVLNGADRLQIFVVGANTGQVYTCELINTPQRDWQGGPWFFMGGPVDTLQLAVGKNTDGLLELFALRRNGRVSYNKQTNPASYASWGQWTDIGAVDWKQLIIGINADGRLEAFALVDGGQVLHMWQESPSGAWSLPAFFGRTGWKVLSVGRNADGRMELFAIGPDNSGYHLWQVAPNNGWSDWIQLGGISWQQLEVISNPDGRMELFILAGGDIYHMWQTMPNNGWSSAVSFGAHDLRYSEIAENADGRLELFALGGNSYIYHIWMTAVNNGWTSQWSPLGDGATQQYVVNLDEEERLVLVYLHAEGIVFLLGQAVPNGDWTSPARLSDPESKPIVTLTADRKKINQGETTTLSWTSSYATELHIDSGIGPVGIPSGSRVVSPPHTHTYTITATALGGTATDTQHIEVIEPNGQPSLLATLVFRTPPSSQRPTTSVTLNVSGTRVGAPTPPQSGDTFQATTTKEVPTGSPREFVTVTIAVLKSGSWNITYSAPGIINPHTCPGVQVPGISTCDVTGGQPICMQGL